MSTAEQILGMSSRHPLKVAFLRWQCRVRQIAMRDRMGRPDDGIMPALTLPGDAEPMGHIITVMSKAHHASKTPELQHLVLRTHDPAERRNKALQLLSETYYQSPGDFSDILTATFPPDSPGAARIREAGTCSLAFEAYGQRFDLSCKVWTLAKHNPLHKATWWHNLLFNPSLPPDTVILGFEPDWDASTADPGFQ
jgi:hypothetical protein